MYRPIILAVVLAAFMTVTATSRADFRPYEPGDVAVAHGSAAANALKHAGASCKAQAEALARCNEDLEKCERELEIVVLDCYGMSVSQWRGKKPPKKSSKPVKPPKKKTEIVDECVGEARLVGNRCSCDHLDPLPGTTKKPVLVRTDGSSDQYRYWTCTYDSEALMAYSRYVDGNMQSICVLGYDGEYRDASTEERCRKTGEVLTDISVWVYKLRTERNDVPSFNRLEWEKIYKRVSDLWALYNALLEGICELCECKDGEPPKIACKRWKDKLNGRLDEIETTLGEHEEQLGDHEQRITGLEEETDELRREITRRPTLEWGVTGGGAYVVRGGENTVNTTQAVVSPFIQFCTSDTLCWRGKGNFGKGWNANDTDTAVAGGEASVLIALDESRQTSVAVGVRGEAETNGLGHGNDSINVLARAGVQFRPGGGAFVVEPWVAAGGSNTLRQYDSVAEREGPLRWVTAGAIGVDLGFIVSGGGDDEESASSTRSEELSVKKRATHKRTRAR